MSGTTTPSNTWLDQTVSVRVTDGRLSISAPGGGSGRLNFVHITQTRMDAKIDFCPATAPDVTGYLADDSSAYAARPSGHTYGWSAGDANAAFVRTPNATVAGSALDTPVNNSIVVAGTRKWEIEVPLGAYKVRAVAGDASGGTLGDYQCTAEGVTFLNGTLDNTTAANHFIDRSVSVFVTDGKLTLAVPDGAPAGTKLHLSLVEISEAAQTATHKPVPGWQDNQPVVGGGGSGSAAGPSAANSVNLASGVYENSPGPDIVVRNPVGPSMSFARFYTSATALQYAAVTPYEGGGGTETNSDTDEDDSGDFLGINGLGTTYPTTTYNQIALPSSGSAGFSTGWTHEYDVTILSLAYGNGNNPPNTIPTVLKMHSPDGSAETLTAELNAQGQPTGKLIPSPGAPYIASGNYDATNKKWTQVVIVKGDGSRLIFGGHFNGFLSPHSPGATGTNTQTYSGLRLLQMKNMLGQAVELAWDASHRLRRIYNVPSPANNNDSRTLLSIVYSQNTVLTDAYGRVVHFTKDSFGNLIKVSNVGASKTVWQYAYNAGVSYLQYYGGNIVSIPLLSSVSKPRPDGGTEDVTSTVDYDPIGGFVRSIRDANGNTDEYLYQDGIQTGVNTREAITGKILSTYTQKFDPANGNRSTETVDADGNPAGVQYNSTTYPLAPSRATNENGQKVDATYDAWGNVTDTVYPNGNILGELRTHTQYEYDTNSANPLFPIGRPIYVAQVPDGAEPSASRRKSSYAYTTRGQVQSVTSARPGSTNGDTVTTTYTYTTLGNVETVTMPGPNGAPVVYKYYYVSDPAPGYSYNRPEGEQLGEPLAIEDPLQHFTHLRYDTRGNLVARIDAVGNQTNFEYNDEDQLKFVIYPATGQTGSGRGYTEYAYLYAGGPVVSVNVYDESGTRVRNTDSAKGGEAETTQVAGGVPTVNVAYDGKYRVKSIADGKNQSTSHDYSAVGNLTEMRLPGHTGTGTEDKIQFTAYDKVGNLNGVINGHGQSITVGRQSNNNLVSSVAYGAFPGRDISLTYDVYGRVTQRTDYAGVYLYQFDDTDRIMRVETRYRAFDVEGKATSAFMPAQVVTYTYNQNGSVQRIGTSIGDYVYEYDDAGRMTRLVPPWSAAQNSGVCDYQYDAADRLTSQTTKALTTTLAYDARSRVRDLKNIAHLLLDRYLEYSYTDMTYDALGNRLSANFRGDRIPRMNYSEIYGWSDPGLNPRRHKTDATLTWRYDEKDRLIGESRILIGTDPALTPAQIAAYSFDYTVGGTQTSYQYDGAGNPTKIRGTTGYSYNINNQLVGTPGNNNGAYVYDGDGNPTTYVSEHYGSTDKRHFDEEGRFTGSTFQAEGGTLIRDRMAYRADGQLACYMRMNNAYISGRIDVYAGLNYIIYDEVSGHALYNFIASSTGEFRRGTGVYIPLTTATGYRLDIFEAWGVNGLCQEYLHLASATPSTRVGSYGYDAQCGVAVWVGNGFTPSNPSHGVLYAVDTALFDGYGRKILNGVYEMNGYGKQWGYRQYGVGEFIHCGYRWYDPANARWLTRDPIGYEGGINLYAYCDGNPVMKIDPEGAAPKRPAHKLTTTVVESGNVLSVNKYVSGNMTPQQKAMGFPKGSLDSHTEAQACTKEQLKPGQTMILRGKYRPCSSCKGRMNAMARQTKGSLIYRWRENDRLQSWVANAKKGEPLSKIGIGKLKAIGVQYRKGECEKPKRIERQRTHYIKPTGSLLARIARKASSPCSASSPDGID